MEPPIMVAIVAAIAAFFTMLINGSSYFLNRRAMTRQQASLVYANVERVETLESGTAPVFFATADVHAFVDQRPGEHWHPDTPLPHAAGRAIISVHNRSDQLIGPVSVRLAFKDTFWPASPGVTLDALEPGKSVRVCLVSVGIPNRKSETERPPFKPDIQFSDSSDRWWRRVGTTRPSRVRVVPQFDGDPRSLPPMRGYFAIMRSNGYTPSAIRSVWHYSLLELSWYVPGGAAIVRRFKLRERAELHAINKYHDGIFIGEHVSWVRNEHLIYRSIADRGGSAHG